MNSLLPSRLSSPAPTTGPVIAARIRACGPAHAAAGDTVATPTISGGTFAIGVPALIVALVAGTGRAYDAAR